MSKRINGKNGCFLGFDHIPIPPVQRELDMSEQPGSHVKGPSAGVIVHELGHNFGLWHANRNEGEGLRPNSDEGVSVDYGNPYSVMGTGGISADFTISSKVYLNESGSFGLKSGTESNASVDVVDLNDSIVVANSGLDEPDATNPNTFRVYRHDYGSAPYPLVARTFELDIPSGSKPATLDSLLALQNLKLFVGGPGEGAEGYVQKRWKSRLPISDHKRR